MLQLSDEIYLIRTSGENTQQVSPFVLCTMQIFTSQSCDGLFKKEVAGP